MEASAGSRAGMHWDWATGASADVGNAVGCSAGQDFTVVLLHCEGEGFPSGSGCCCTLLTGVR